MCVHVLCRFCEKGSLERAVRLGKFKRKTEEQAELVGAGILSHCVVQPDLLSANAMCVACL